MKFFAKFLRTSILKNICERLLLLVSPQNTIKNSGGKFGLDETLKECILLNQMQLYNLHIVKISLFNISINILINFLTMHNFKF